MRKHVDVEQLDLEVTVTADGVTVHLLATVGGVTRRVLVDHLDTGTGTKYHARLAADDLVDTHITPPGGSALPRAAFQA